MNVRHLNQTSVVRTPCVPILKELMFADVRAVSKATEGIAQVNILEHRLCYICHPIMDHIRGTQARKE